jgi:hypothetical protein
MDLGLQRQRVYGAADLRSEDLVDETVLLDAATPGKRRGGDGGVEVVACAGVVLALGARARDGGLDVLGVGMMEVKVRTFTAGTPGGLAGAPAWRAGQAKRRSPSD